MISNPGYWQAVDMKWSLDMRPIQMLTDDEINEKRAWREVRFDYGLPSQAPLTGRELEIILHKVILSVLSKILPEKKDSTLDYLIHLPGFTRQEAPPDLAPDSPLRSTIFK